MQAVLPFGIIAVLAVGLVMVALALDAPIREADRGGLTLMHEASEAGTRVVAVRVEGSPSWLDLNAHTRDGFPIPHRYEGYDEVVDVGEALVLVGNEVRHDNATVTFRGSPVYVVWGLF